jgi:hypothetical protein
MHGPINIKFLYKITTEYQEVNAANNIKLAAFMAVTTVELNSDVYLYAAPQLSLTRTDVLYDPTASLEATKRGTAFLNHGTISASIRCFIL